MLQSKPRIWLIVRSVLGLAVAAVLVYGSVPLMFESTWRAGGLGLSMAICIVTFTTYAWFNRNSSKIGSAVLSRVRGSTVRYERWGLLWRCVVVASVALMTAFTLWFLVPLWATFYVSLALRSVRNGWVELDADGVRHRGWSFDMRAPWDCIRTVQIENRTVRTRHGFWLVRYQCVVLKPEIVLPEPGHNTARLWRIEKMPLFAVELDCRRFDVHPVVLQEWIAFYLHNPKMRFELGTDAAAERLAAIAL
ncbi:hypothetical protein [Rhodococcus sovatensis]|uniref:PH domain-containing protein n=1 Tax=Rhodococcus sovatensis TaxID=1805840 RepID=A0ABZ2PKW6_9NOCA